MTDARLPERLLMDRRLQRLTDSHFRSYINALLFSVANRSDGVIEPEDLGLIPGLGANAAKGLVDAQLWLPRAPTGWLIADYSATQTSRSDLETLERVRAADRKKKARKRAGEAAAAGVGTGDVPGDASRGLSPVTAQAGRQAGKAGTRGKEGDPDQVPGRVIGDDGWRGPGPSPFDEYK